jgi:hypothetical protein
MRRQSYFGHLVRQYREISAPQRELSWILLMGKLSLLPKGFKVTPEMLQRRACERLAAQQQETDEAHHQAHGVDRQWVSQLVSMTMSL